MKPLIIFLLILFIWIGFSCHKHEPDIRTSFNMYSWLTIEYDSYIQKVDGGYISEVYGSGQSRTVNQLFIPNPSHSMDEYYLRKHNARQERISASCCGGN